MRTDDVITLSKGMLKIRKSCFVPGVVTLAEVFSQCDREEKFFINRIAPITCVIVEIIQEWQVKTGWD